ncbi:MAG: tripartite tricarboxylate transporter substrate binding protein [Betaproteobacteria bacterium]|nr:tripartite tricarboxylate transporter substrate binding protein [Betaproteobacteria bacterium]
MLNALLFVVTFFGASLCLSAEVYPTRPVRVIVPYGTGNSTDVSARIISQQLTEQLGKSFVVDNRAGASGIIGSGLVAKSAPDGHTLLAVDISFSILPGLYKSLPYDALKDFTPITEITGAPLVLVVHPSLKANTLKEFIAFAQANPGKINYGSGGVGAISRLSAELLKKAAKVDIVLVTYREGAAAAMNAVVGGEIEMLISVIPTVLGQVKSGKLRALAVTTDGKRVPSLPDVPSMNEAGVSGMTVYTWIGLFGPGGIPKEVVNKLHAEVVKAIAVPSVRERLIGLGVDPVGSSPEEFSNHIRDELRRWAEVVKSARITVE